MNKSVPPGGLLLLVVIVAIILLQKLSFLPAGRGIIASTSDQPSLLENPFYKVKPGLLRPPQIYVPIITRQSGETTPPPSSGRISIWFKTPAALRFRKI
jgi:hypothetical protein